MKNKFKKKTLNLVVIFTMTSVLFTFDKTLNSDQFLVSPSEEVKKSSDLQYGANFGSEITYDEFGNQHLYSWGLNNYGQLGDGTKVDKLEPVEIYNSTLGYVGNSDYAYDTLSTGTITDFNVGWSFTTLVIQDNNFVDHIYSWGDGGKGNLGNAGASSSVPVEIYNSEIGYMFVAYMPIGKVQFLDSGSATSALVIEDSENVQYLYTWGPNTYGALGINKFGNGSSFPIEIYNTRDGYYIPEIKMLLGTITDLQFGGYSGFVTIVDENNIQHLFSWGQGTNGENGIGTGLDQFYPIEIYNSSNGYYDSSKIMVSGSISEINVGLKNSMMIIEDANNVQYLYSWGDNHYGTIGNNSESIHENAPVKIYDSQNGYPYGENMALGTITSIENGEDISGIIIKDAQQIEHLYIFGFNYYGQLGLGSSDKYLKQRFPLEIYNTKDGYIGNSEYPDILEPGKIIAFSMGVIQSVGLIIEDNSGLQHYYAWGYNGGALKLNNISNKNIPTEGDII